jgi:hypothetical protein
MANDRVSIQMYVSRETRRQLRILAAERSTSVSELLRQSLQKHFDAEGVKINLSEGLENWGGSRRDNSDEE